MCTLENVYCQLDTMVVIHYLILCGYYSHSPVDCGIPRSPENGIIENIQSITTVGGAQIVFRCNPRYIPAGRMSATCVSLDGVSVVGTWTPNPADLVCNGEIQEAENCELVYY